MAERYPILRTATSKEQRILSSVLLSPYLTTAKFAVKRIPTSLPHQHPGLIRQDSCSVIATSQPMPVSIKFSWADRGVPMLPLHSSIAKWMGTSVPKAGTIGTTRTMKKTARYAEYGSTGKGGNSSQRVAWAKRLTEKEAAVYDDIYTIFNQSTPWNPIAD